MKPKIKAENQDAPPLGYEDLLYEQQRDMELEMKRREEALDAFLAELEPAEDDSDFVEDDSKEVYRPRMLPVVEIEGKRYFVDERLKQLRNVANPHDRIDFI